MRARAQAFVGLAAREARGLEWISEQYAVRLDQLALVMGVTGRGARASAERLVAGGLLRRAWFLVDEPSWVWLTAAGQRQLANGFSVWRPKVGVLAHLAAVNDVRLHVEDAAPAAEWVCERTLARERRAGEHLPDAVVVTGGERHAIEVELTTKSARALDEILAELSARFDRVVYFAAPPVRALLARLDALAQYPKLVVRELPPARRVLP